MLKIIIISVNATETYFYLSLKFSFLKIVFYLTSQYNFAEYSANVEIN